MRERLLDRNGIPILDPPREANKLPKCCADDAHAWVTVRRDVVFVGDDSARVTARVTNEQRCQRCGQQNFSIKTKVYIDGRDFS